MKIGKTIWKISTFGFAASVILVLIASAGWSADPVLLRQKSPPSLKLVPIPEPANLNEYVVDRAAAIKLGKALFWDMQVGSDGVQACATCHFQAGADNRFKNQLSPGLNGGDTTFQVGGPNLALAVSHFPFHQRANPDFQNSPITRDRNDVASSMGVILSQFVDIIPGSFLDQTTPIPDPVFNVGGRNTRRVEPRNAPTVINAVFNFANFWDGRANNIFNGVNPFGPADLNAKVWANNNGALVQVPTVGLNNSSLASQAVGPPGSEFEMSARNRPFPKIGKKMLSLAPLARQKVSPTDSVLGPYSNSPNPGITIPPHPTSVAGESGYVTLIRYAFNPKYWDSPTPVVIGTSTDTQMEANFSLFFGLAVQLYEATLVSDETPFDRFAAGDNNALTPQQLDGLDIFLNQGKCINCHAGAEFTSASVSAARFLNNASHGLLETVPQVQTTVVYDQGYYNIGLTRTSEDLGRGGTAPFTNPLTGSPFPLSFILLAELQVQGLLPFPTPQLSSAFPIDFIRASTAGRFKASGLRNVELTGPFFHNGGAATLEEVVDFYTRGGNFPLVNIADLDVDIDQIPFLQGLPDRTAAVVAFLKGLTDERVRQEIAPFDHPQLFVPNGHPGDNGSLTCTNGGNACDTLVSIPAVGAGGRPAAGLPPLQPFLTGAKYFAAGDFDKDGKADIAVWRPGDGSWRIIRSSDGAVIVPQWGLGTAPVNDIPVPGDYDGDGKTDLAVWRPGEGNWYIKRSSDGVVTTTQWGLGVAPVNDIPVPGDYDGDGKTDLAVWRPGDGTWYVKRSSDGVVTATPWGTLDDVPVPGDYDGDGKTDLAVWRPGDGTWYVKRSSDGVITTTPWGAGNLNDIPVPADYDGDGKTDIAVYRPGPGDWFVIPSGGEAPYTIHWGGDPLDIPLPPL